MAFTPEHTAADIVKVFPKASDFFKEHRIDYCCGGDRPLRQSFIEQNLNETALLSSLNQAYATWKEEDHDITDWDKVSLTQLVDHITETYHSYIGDELVPLGQFVTKIYRVHGSHHPHLKELHRLYHEFKTEMEEHTIQEDQVVFHLIKQYDQHPSEELLEQIREANGGLEDEHSYVGDLLKQIRDLTEDFTLPDGACNSYRITYARLEELESNTFQHIHLENNILFKRLTEHDQ